jgi:hypothetical protein
MSLEQRLELLDKHYAEHVAGPSRDAQLGLLARAERPRKRMATRGLPYAQGRRGSLPISTARRAQLINKLAPRRTVLFSDVDGLVSELTGTVDVVGYGQKPKTFDASNSNLFHHGSSGAWNLEGSDVAVFEVTLMTQALDRLKSAIAGVKKSGTVLARVRAPLAGSFDTMLRGLGIPVFSRHERVDYTLLPSGHVVEDAGDIWVMTAAVRPPAGPYPVPNPNEASYVVHDLDPTRLGESPLQRLTARTTELLGKPTPSFDADFQGSDLVLRIAPYDDVLDHALLCAACELFATDTSRVTLRG